MICSESVWHIPWQSEGAQPGGREQRGPEALPEHNFFQKNVIFATKLNFSLLVWAKYLPQNRILALSFNTNIYLK